MFEHTFDNIDQPTLSMGLWCLCLYVAVFVMFYKANLSYAPSRYQTKQLDNPYRTVSLSLLFLLLALTFWVATDFFGYLAYAALSNTGWKFTPEAPMEYGHQAICSLVDGNWLGFRFFCWGGALFLYLLTAKRLRINIQNALFILFAISPVTFCYGRVTLAMAVYFFGLTFLIRPIKTKKSGRMWFLSFIIGVCIILTCSWFHDSARLMIAVTPVVYLNVHNLRSNFVILFLVVGIFVYVFLNIDTLYNSNQLEEHVSGKLNRYREKDLGEANIFGYIENTMSFTARYLPVAIIAKVVLFKKAQVSQAAYRLTLACLFIVIIATAFYFSGQSQYVLFYRVLNMAMIPTSLLIAYLHMNGFMSRKQFFWSVAVGIFYSFYYFLYHVYKLM